MTEIDATTYRKDTKHPPRWGYQARGNSAPSSIVIHTTSDHAPAKPDPAIPEANVVAHGSAPNARAAA